MVGGAYIARIDGFDGKPGNELPLGRSLFTNHQVKRDLPRRFSSFQWHSYEFELPPNAVPLASDSACLQAYRAGENAWGIQFHAEVTKESVDDWFASSKPPDAPLDLPALQRETAEKIADWNELGKRLCSRFLERASSR